MTLVASSSSFSSKAVTASSSIEVAISRMRVTAL